MKKVVLFFMVLMAAFVQAQEVTPAAASTPEATPAVTPVVTSANPLYRAGELYYYGETVMEKKAYARFLQESCPLAYEQYRKGYKTATAGWVLLGAGLGIDVAACITLLTTKKDLKSAATSRTAFNTLAAVALGCEIACIPTLCVGYSQMHNSVDIFNAACHTRRSQAYWSVNASENGIGVAYNF